MLNLNEIAIDLRRHAEGTTNADDSSILADHAWMLRHGTTRINLEPIWNDIISLFDRLNVELRRIGQTENLPWVIVYAVSGLSKQCLDIQWDGTVDGPVRQEFIYLGWKILSAWDAVLAGDINNIAEHVELERLARASEG